MRIEALPSSPRTMTGVNAAPWSGRPAAPDYGTSSGTRAYSYPKRMHRTQIALCYGSRPQVIEASELLLR
jgi:hypothetical protein